MSCFDCFLSSYKEDEDPRYGRPNLFHQSMMNSCGNPGYCCFACLLPPCSSCVLRRRVLEGNMENYRCCQGYYDGVCCWRSSCGEENCGELCNCLEAFLCQSCSVSSSRMAVMDTYELQSDICDRRIIGFNNCMQCLACICHVAAIFQEDLRECAVIVERIADIVYCMTQACMQTQVYHEIDFQKKQANFQNATPARQQMQVPPLDHEQSVNVWPSPK